MAAALALVAGASALTAEAHLAEVAKLEAQLPAAKNAAAEVIGPRSMTPLLSHTPRTLRSHPLAKSRLSPPGTSSATATSCSLMSSRRRTKPLACSSRPPSRRARCVPPATPPPPPHQPLCGVGVVLQPAYDKNAQPWRSGGDTRISICCVWSAFVFAFSVCSPCLAAWGWSRQRVNSRV